MTQLLSVMAFVFSMVIFANQGQALTPPVFTGHSAVDFLAIQDAGRVKPFDTFAREQLELIYGKQTFAGKPATDIVMTWLLQPDEWQKKEIFEIRHDAVKKLLNLEAERKHFTLIEILNNERFSLAMQELISQRETKEKLNPYFQALQRIETQVFTFKEIASGKLLRFLPPRPGAEDPQHTWLGLADFPPEAINQFVKINQAFVEKLGAPAGAESPALSLAVSEFQEFAKSVNPELYPSAAKMTWEVHYNDFHPFKWSWILYLIAGLIGLLSWLLVKEKLFVYTWILTWTALVLQLYGWGLRVYISERAPVTNMYETVIWVGFGAILFAMIIEYVYRWKFILTAGALVAAFCLALSDAAPVVLDPSLHPLEPVLRNNFWLLVHVLTITISYSAFFLAFALGDMGLLYYLKGEPKDSERVKAISLSIYRSMQIGIGFLGPGIILGGIWADYSWGRFWGWDPKETWALIAFLGYLAILHARMAGLLKDFGTIASAVATFSLVIMAWYGVNFVLGAGLHSYGFGAGGVEYVSAFVAAHFLLIAYVSIVRRNWLKKNQSVS